jgi:hypothetical protein
VLPGAALHREELGVDDVLLRRVAASTQNQALSTLLLLYRDVRYTDRPMSGPRCRSALRDDM